MAPAPKQGTDGGMVLAMVPTRYARASSTSQPGASISPTMRVATPTCRAGVMLEERDGYYAAGRTLRRSRRSVLFMRWLSI
ncbi:hypothetical protein ACNKHX_07580 [Shigella flexneri]